MEKSEVQNCSVPHLIFEEIDNFPRTRRTLWKLLYNPTPHSWRKWHGFKLFILIWPLNLRPLETSRCCSTHRTSRLISITPQATGDLTIQNLLLSHSCHLPSSTAISANPLMASKKKDATQKNEYVIHENFSQTLQMWQVAQNCGSIVALSSAHCSNLLLCPVSPHAIYGHV